MKLPLAIVLVQSRRQPRQYYVGVPRADVDYVTDGLVVLTSRTRLEVLLDEASPKEYPLGPDVAAVRCAERTNRQLKRDDLAPVIKDLNQPARPKTWRGSRGTWKFAFQDIHDPSDFADPVAEVSQTKFRAAGGILTDLRGKVKTE